MLIYGGNQHNIVNYPSIKNKFLKKERTYIYVCVCVCVCVNTSALQPLHMEFN